MAGITQAFVAAGGAGYGQLLEEPWGAEVAHGEAPAAGLVAEGAGEVAFARCQVLKLLFGFLAGNVEGRFMFGLRFRRVPNRFQA